MVTSTASPSPSDITTEGVSAPGRWMLAIASRSMVMRLRGSAARQRHQTGGDAAQQREDRHRRDDEDRRDPFVIGKSDRDRDQQRDHHRHQRQITPARPMPFARDLLAEQRRNRHVVHPAERP